MTSSVGVRPVWTQIHGQGHNQGRYGYPQRQAKRAYFVLQIHKTNTVGCVFSQTRQYLICDWIYYCTSVDLLNCDISFICTLTQNRSITMVSINCEVKRQYYMHVCRCGRALDGGGQARAGTSIQNGSRRKTEYCRNNIMHIQRTIVVPSTDGWSPSQNSWLTLMGPPCRACAPAPLYHGGKNSRGACSLQFYIKR